MQGPRDVGEGNGGRTHEPNLRELTSDSDGQFLLLLSKIEALEALLDERDRLYSERDTSRKTAVDAALAAAKEAVAAALLTAKEAAGKAEDAAKVRFESFNEFNTRIDTLTRSFPTREVVETSLASLTTRLAAVELHQASDSGAKNQAQVTQSRQEWSTGLIVTAIFGIFGTIGTILGAVYLIVAKASGH
jgi:hypothetical protein